MDNKSLSRYCAPAVYVVELRSPRPLCASKTGSTEGVGFGNDYGDDDFN